MNVPRVENCIYSGAMKFQSIIIAFARILVMRIISGYPEGEYGKIFEKNKSPSNWLKSIQVNSVFYADSEYDNSFNIGSVFYSRKVLTKGQKASSIM
jgi:hypothetical protein